LQKKVGNKGAYVKLDGDCHPTCVSFAAVPHPDVKPMAYSRQFSQFGM
jgi:serine/threonine-protein phosphatase 5